jgi:chromosome segregation and condensation protein ScpB
MVDKPKVIEIDPIKEDFEKAKERMKKLMKQYKNKDIDMDAVKKSYKIWTK